MSVSVERLVSLLAASTLIAASASLALKQIFLRYGLIP